MRSLAGGGPSGYPRDQTLLLRRRHAEYAGADAKPEHLPAPSAQASHGHDPKLSSAPNYLQYLQIHTAGMDESGDLKSRERP